MLILNKQLGDAEMFLSMILTEDFSDLKRLVHISTILIVAVLTTSCSSSRKLGSDILFKSPANDTIPYRIPALAVLEGNKLLALTDYRLCKSDIGFGRVDIHGRFSNDGGKSWEEPFVLIEGSGISKAADCGFGDAAIVADRESDDVLVVLVCGETVYWHETTTRQNPNRIAMLHSSDNGKTWSPWVEMTEQIYSLFDESSHGCVQSCFIASGKICQSRKIKVGSHYRIYAAMCARPNGNRVIYSDDFGKTWSVLGTADDLPVLKGDEPKCEELPDGSVVISSRAWGGRYFNIFRYSDDAEAGKGSQWSSGKWLGTAGSGPRNNGCIAVSNSCNGELLIIPARRTSDRKKVHIALQSVPLGPDRTNVGIYYKELPEDISQMSTEDFAANWEKPYQVSDTTSAYSTMVQLKNGNIAFYYEETLTQDRWGYDMVYKELPLETITEGQYR